MKSCWQELGIGATTNQRAIKLAYAERIKQVHPEEDPEGFKRLQAAYKAALQYSKDASTTPRTQAEPLIELTKNTVLDQEDLSKDFDFSAVLSSDSDDKPEQIEQTWQEEHRLLEVAHYISKVKEACIKMPYYRHLYQILQSAEFDRYINEQQAREQLTADLTKLTFYGEEEERQETLLLCQRLQLTDLANYLEAGEQTLLEEQFKIDLEELEQKAQAYLVTLLAKLELVTDFYLLLKEFRTDAFAYYVTSNDFRQDLTKHLLNYYFYGPWEHRLELVQICQQYNLPELAGHLYWIGLKNPSAQIGLTTERLV